jgi:hypothetical protein
VVVACGVFVSVIVVVVACGVVAAVLSFARVGVLDARSRGLVRRVVVRF